MRPRASASVSVQAPCLSHSPLRSGVMTRMLATGAGAGRLATIGLGADAANLRVVSMTHISFSLLSAHALLHSSNCRGQ